MSIYIFVDKINESVKRNIISLELPKIIAYDDDKEFRLENYNETKLEKFCSRKSKKIKIHPYFWNHNYCTLDMLDVKVKIGNIETPDTIILDVENYIPGIIIMMISFYNIIYITYTLQNTYEYENFLNRLNIDRNIFSQFLIENNFNLPLTTNYLLLIKRIFTGDNITTYLFNKPMHYDYKDIANILSFFDYGSINDISQYIFSSNMSEKDKLCLCQELMRNYNYSIDSVNINYLDTKIFKDYLNYYLYTMLVPDKLENIYFETWNIFLTNGGAPRLIIINDDILNNKIERRYQILKDYFNL
jgi:hypothetical protein